MSFKKFVTRGLGRHIVPAAAVTFILGILMLAGSCQKQYIDKFNIIPGDTVTVSLDNEIESFSITDYSADTTLKASIVGDSIIFIWPMYKEVPEAISPAISTSAGSSISPASGASVPFVTGTEYVVKAESGAEKKYYIKVQYAQIEPWFDLMSYTYTQGTIGQIPGDLWFEDVSKTKVIFVDADDGAEFEAEMLEISRTSGSSQQKAPTFFIGDNIPSNKSYTLKVINGVRTVYNRNKDSRFTISASTEPNLIIHAALGYPFTIRPRDEVTLRGWNISEVNKFFLKRNSSDLGSEVEVVSTSSTAVTLKIPVGFPTGTYVRYSFNYGDSGVKTGTFTNANAFKIIE